MNFKALYDPDNVGGIPKIIIKTKTENRKSYHKYIYCCMDHLLEDISKFFHKPELLNGTLISDPKEEEFMQFYNSHILRANLARIVGLINLLMIDEIDNKPEIIEKLESEVEDLQLSLEEIKFIIKKFINR